MLLYQFRAARHRNGPQIGKVVLMVFKYRRQRQADRFAHSRDHMQARDIDAAPPEAEPPAHRLVYDLGDVHLQGQGMVEGSLWSQLPHSLLLFPRDPVRAHKVESAKVAVPSAPAQSGLNGLGPSLRHLQDQ